MTNIIGIELVLPANENGNFGEIQSLMFANEYIRVFPYISQNGIAGIGGAPTKNTFVETQTQVSERWIQSQFSPRILDINLTILPTVEKPDEGQKAKIRQRMVEYITSVFRILGQINTELELRFQTIYPLYLGQYTLYVRLNSAGPTCIEYPNTIGYDLSISLIAFDPLFYGAKQTVTVTKDSPVSDWIDNDGDVPTPLTVVFRNEANHLQIEREQEPDTPAVDIELSTNNIKEFTISGGYRTPVTASGKSKAGEYLGAYWVKSSTTIPILLPTGKVRFRGLLSGSNPIITVSFRPTLSGLIP